MSALAWLVTALWLVVVVELAVIVAQLWVERVREDRQAWRTPSRWMLTGNCDAVDEPDESTEFAAELPAPTIQRMSPWSSQQPVLLDPLPEDVDGYAIGGRYRPRHASDEIAEPSEHEPRHSVLASITAEFDAIVARSWPQELLVTR